MTKNYNKLKAFRLKHKLSQLEASKIIGVSQAQYQRLESGVNVLNAVQLIQLSNHYNCTPNDLLGFKAVHTIVAAQLDDEI